MKESIDRKDIKIPVYWTEKRLPVKDSDRQIKYAPLWESNPCMDLKPQENYDKRLR